MAIAVVCNKSLSLHAAFHPRWLAELLTLVGWRGTLARPASAQAAFLVLCVVCSYQRMIRRLNSIVCVLYVAVVCSCQR